MFSGGVNGVNRRELTFFYKRDDENITVSEVKLNSEVNTHI